MFSKLLRNDLPTAENAPGEGDLYRVVHAFGKTFELRYGYYGESDRKYEPDILYPDFAKAPQYTETGEPLVTVMQDACGNYCGGGERAEDTTCADCRHCRRGEDRFGLCTCPENNKNSRP